MNQQMTRIARARSLSFGSPECHTATSSFHSRWIIATSVCSIALNSVSATSSMASASVTGMSFLLVVGVGGRQPMMYQRPQTGRHLIGAVVEVTPADRRGQVGFVGGAEGGQRLGDRAEIGGFQLPRHHPQRIGGDAGVEVDLTVGRLADIGVEEVGDRCDELRGGRPAVPA